MHAAGQPTPATSCHAQPAWQEAGSHIDSSAVCGTSPLARVRARRTDPITSHAAAQNVVAFAGSHCDRILAALRKLSTATAAELAQQSGLTVVQIDRRRKEMEQAGLVYMLRQGGQLFTRDGFMVWALAPDACYFTSDEAHS